MINMPSYTASSSTRPKKTSRQSASTGLMRIMRIYAYTWTTLLHTYSWNCQVMSSGPSRLLKPLEIR